MLFINTKTIAVALFLLLSLLLSACSKEPDKQSPKPADPNAPVLEPIGNQVLLENKTFTLNLKATDPNNDNLSFSYPDNYILPNTHIRVNRSYLRQDKLLNWTFTWTPKIAVWETGIIFKRFTEKFIVSDTSEPEPRQDSEDVIFTVMQTEGGVGYMTFCAECHGDDAGGGTIPGTNVDSTNLTGRPPMNLISELSVDTIQKSIINTPEMKNLKSENFTTVQLQTIIDFINTLPVI